MDMSTYFNPTGAGGPAQSTTQSDQFSQIMLAFLTQNGVMEQGENVVDKAKFQKQLRDLREVENQMTASEWSSFVTQANAWVR